MEKGKSQPMQPYLLARGVSRECIDQYFIIVDHYAIPCSDNSPISAVDILFKTHYVFGLHYARPLQNFWTFIQTTIYGIDTETTNESPRVRELRSKVATN